MGNQFARRIMAEAMDQLPAFERERFLHVVHEATQVESHLQLYSWLQGDFQHFVRHQALLAFVGDFSGTELSYDFVSPLPAIRTQICLDCQRLPVNRDLFSFWSNNGRKMLAFDGPVSKLVDTQCNCSVGQALLPMGAAVVHGLRDARGGDDALYLFCREGAGFDQRERAMLQMLLPQIDFACRRVVALEGRRATVADVALETPLMSDRELEVMEWVRAGKTNSEIGEILDISPFTVKNHLQRIFRKMNVLNRAQAVAKLASRNPDRA